RGGVGRLGFAGGRVVPREGGGEVRAGLAYFAQVVLADRHFLSRMTGYHTVDVIPVPVRPCPTYPPPPRLRAFASSIFRAFVPGPRACASSRISAPTSSRSKRRRASRAKRWAGRATART